MAYEHVQKTKLPVWSWLKIRELPKFVSAAFLFVWIG